MVSFAVSPTEFVLAAAIAATIALVAHRRHLLDRGGAVAATILGPSLVATGGWWLGTILIAFFLSSALLPDSGSGAPSRAWHQVAANGGPALALATIGLAGFEGRLLVAAASTIAATTSDTWATEIGRAIGGTPRSIRTGARVPPGTSGAVSAAGTIASVAGAMFVAILAVILSPIAPMSSLVTPEQAVIIGVCGVLGSSVDTILGATLQARFRCVTCGARSEDPGDHAPGHGMRRISGMTWMTNSMVNLVSALASGLVAFLLTG